MSTFKSAAWIVLAACLLFPATPAGAQGVKSFDPGIKYPWKQRMTLKRPSEPGRISEQRMLPGQNGLLKSTETDMHPDSVFSWSNYDGYSIKTLYTYDCNGKIQKLLYQWLNGDEWVNYIQYVYAYNADGKLASETDQQWDGISWMDYLLLTYNYNASGILESYLYNDLWSGFMELITLTWDANGNKITELGQLFDGTNYSNLELYTYTYDANGNMINRHGQGWNGTGWDDLINEIWTYNANNKWIVDLIQSPTGSGWVDYIRYLNTYDAQGNRTTYTGEYLDAIYGWLPLAMGMYTYDSHGNVLTDQQMYNASYNATPIWENSTLVVSQFDYMNQRIKGLGYVWTNGEWVAGDTYIYIPFNNNGVMEPFANEYPSYEADVYYSAKDFQVEAGPDATIYIGYQPGSAQLNASGADHYTWSPATGLSDPNVANPIASPQTTTTYTVTGTNPEGCFGTDQVTVTVIDVRCGKKMDKVLVCMVPPGNPKNAHTVCVSPSAVPSLLASGSYLGPCDETGFSPQNMQVMDELAVGVTPNPVVSGFEVNVYAPVPESYVITLFDNQGTRVQEVFRGELQAGENTLNVGAIRSSRKGIFFLNVQSPSQSKTVKVVKNE